ncbi:hypothetical protein [Methylovirgula ligni]|uniref:hypothetical protein n=1 Tax=Methylovirgula ligni TaxID=569860 RepID=UPI001012A2C3|nr:hypothetical protein [Methylovirgula ligni]
MRAGFWKRKRPPEGGGGTGGRFSTRVAGTSFRGKPGFNALKKTVSKRGETGTEILLNAFAAQQNFEYCGAVMQPTHDLMAVA